MPAIRNPPPSKKKSHSRAHPPGYIPRPRNAFFIFRSAFYKSHKEEDDDSKINQQDLSKQVAIIWNEMSEDEREPFVVQAEEEKRRHAEMYPGYVYAPNGTNGKAKGKAKGKATSSFTRRKTNDDDDAYTISSSRPRRRVVTTPATPPASSPSSNYSPQITPGADSFPATEYQWQQSPQPHLRSLLDSPFDSSSPSPLPSPEALMLPSPAAYEPHSLLASPVHEGSGCGLRLPEAPIPDCPDPLQLNFSYPSPPVSPSSSTGATAAGSVVDSNGRPWWPVQGRAAYGLHGSVSPNAVPCQPQYGPCLDQRIQVPPSLLYHDNIIDGLADYILPNDSAAIDELIKLNLPPIPAFDEALAGARQEFGLNLASAKGNAAFPWPPPLIFDFSGLALNAGLQDAPAKGAASSQALPVEDSAYGVNSPTGTSSNDGMSPNLKSPLLLSNPILEEACLAREMALDDMFRRFIDLEAAAS